MAAPAVNVYVNTKNAAVKHGGRAITGSRKIAGRVGGAAGSVGGDVQTATPGTDTFGTVFKILAVAGLAGLFILHPETLGGLQRGVSVIRTVITGVQP